MFQSRHNGIMPWQHWPRKDLGQRSNVSCGSNRWAGGIYQPRLQFSRRNNEQFRAQPITDTIITSTQWSSWWKIAAENWTSKVNLVKTAKTKKTTKVNLVKTAKTKKSTKANLVKTAKTTNSKGQLRSHCQSPGKGEQVEKTVGRKFATKMFPKIIKMLHSLCFQSSPLFWNICKHIVLDWIRGSFQWNKYNFGLYAKWKL